MSVFKSEIKWKDHIVFGAACALVVFIYCWSAEPGFHEVINPQAEDSYYNLLVQGFRSGQLNVKREAPLELAGLANPYDPATNAPYVWNTRQFSYELSYYKGKLYVYQGVTPALVFFWPYAALTGGYCTHKVAVVFFLSLGFLVGAGLLFAAWRRYFAETSIWLLAVAVLAIGLATGALETLSSCDEHQVPHICGFAFVMLALAAIWNSLHQSGRQIFWLICASFAYGLAVGARPSLLFGIIILLIPAGQRWLATTEPFLFKRAGWLLLAAVVPAMLVGLGLAAYNALRFDSPFEFGWRYLLTDIQNESAKPFSLHYFWFNFKLYFLEPVYWNSRFPFLQADIPSGVPTNYYSIGSPYCGMLLNYPFVWLALASVLAMRGRSKTEALSLCWFLWAIFLLFAANGLTLCCFFSGSSGYLSEFLPALIILSGIGVWSLERALTDRPWWRRLARLSWCLLLVYAVVFSLLAAIKGRANNHFVIGNSLSHQGRVGEAVDHYRKSVALDPRSSAFRIGLGNACVKMGDLNEGIYQYQEALERDPNNVEALYDLSLSLIQCGHVDEAVVHFQKSIELNPGILESQNQAVNNNFAWSLATHPESRKRNGKMAVILAEAACRHTHYQNTVMVGTLAAAYAEAGRFDEAISTAQKACSLAASDPDLMKKNQELLSLYLTHRAYHEN